METGQYCNKNKSAAVKEFVFKKVYQQLYYQNTKINNIKIIDNL